MKIKKFNNNWDNIESEKYVSNERGVCPLCNGTSLEYNDCIIDGDRLLYLYQCDDCGFRGEEYFDIEFNSHLTEEGNRIVAGDIVQD